MILYVFCWTGSSHQSILLTADCFYFNTNTVIIVWIDDTQYGRVEELNYYIKIGHMVYIYAMLLLSEENWFVGMVILAQIVQPVLYKNSYTTTALTS
jgi:hypothetical protein